MSFIRPALRPTTSPFRSLGLSRSLHTSRVLALRASPVRRDVVVANDETAGYKYIPGGPVLKGTVNDASTFPHGSASHGSYHWAFERLLSAALIPIMGGAAVSTGSAYPVADALLAVSLIIHSHIGFDSCLQDYLHPRKFTRLGPVMVWVLRAATGAAVWGVYEFNTNDIGLTELVKRMWTA